MGGLMKTKDETDLVGAKVTQVRPMTAAEMQREGWDEDRSGPPTAIVLDNGVTLYASRDTEGNGGGALFGYDYARNQTIMI